MKRFQITEAEYEAIKAKEAIRVLHVIHPRFQALCNGLALVDVHRNDASRCYEHLRIKRKAAIRDSHKPPQANEVQSSKPSTKPRIRSIWFSRR